MNFALLALVCCLRDFGWVIVGVVVEVVRPHFPGTRLGLSTYRAFDRCVFVLGIFSSNLLFLDVLGYAPVWGHIVRVKIEFCCIVF